MKEIEDFLLSGARQVSPVLSQAFTVAAFCAVKGAEMLGEHRSKKARKLNPEVTKHHV